MSSVRTSAVVVVTVPVISLSFWTVRFGGSARIVRSRRFDDCVRVPSCLLHLLAEAGEAVALAQLCRFGQHRSGAVLVCAAAVLGVVVEAVGHPEWRREAAAEGGGV